MPASFSDQLAVVAELLREVARMEEGEKRHSAGLSPGGYGERIVSGLALNDNATLLAGAIPAAALALIVQGAFELGERRFGWMANASR